jgi:hypothetical protein
MHWKYWIPHAWDPPESRLAWADVLILPDDPGYTGDALFITVDAVLNTEAYTASGWPKWRHRKIARLGDNDFFMDRDLMDLAIRAHDFTRDECLDWVARWLQHEGMAFSGFVPAGLDAFKDRSEMGAIVDRIQSQDQEPSE